MINLYRFYKGFNEYAPIKNVGKCKLPLAEYWIAEYILDSVDMVKVDELLVNTTEKFMPCFEDFQGKKLVKVLFMVPINTNPILIESRIIEYLDLLKKACKKPKLNTFKVVNIEINDDYRIRPEKHLNICTEDNKVSVCVTITDVNPDTFITLTKRYYGGNPTIIIKDGKTVTFYFVCPQNNLENKIEKFLIEIDERLEDIKKQTDYFSEICKNILKKFS